MNPTFIVMKKELKELFRDKRVRSNALIMPALVMLLMLSMFGFIMGVGDKQNQIVHVVQADNKLVQKLRDEKVQIIEVADIAEGQKLVREGKARVVLAFEPNFDSNMATGKVATVDAYLDPQQPTGGIALATVEKALNDLNSQAEHDVLEAHHLSPDSIAPGKILKKEVQVGKSKTSELLISMLPYLIVIYAFYGGIASGSDAVAGEKEKYTLETLLITPVKRSQIAMGKFLALATICFLSSFSALMGVVIAGMSKAQMYSKLFPNGLGINAGQLLTMLVVLIPTVAFFASMLIAVSAFAKNTRESQSYLALISLVVLMPAIFGQVIGLTDLASKWWIKLVPVLNTSVTLRESLQGKTDVAGVLMTVGVGAVLGLIGIRIAVHLFNREQVLTRV
jgi:sodium transport system permease protein